ncbi:hypothetical protein OH492_26815 [Vibrio chagasii]|nr:hypothetical protein [Vibrio chagasii]
MNLRIEYLKEGDLAASEEIPDSFRYRDCRNRFRYDELLVKTYNLAGAINNVRNDLQDAQYFFRIKGYN